MGLNNQHFTPKKEKKILSAFYPNQGTFFYLCPLMCCCYYIHFLRIGLPMFCLKRCDFSCFPWEVKCSCEISGMKVPENGCVPATRTSNMDTFMISVDLRKLTGAN